MTKRTAVRAAHRYMHIVGAYAFAHELPYGGWTVYVHKDHRGLAVIAALNRIRTLKTLERSARAAGVPEWRDLYDRLSWDERHAVD